MTNLEKWKARAKQLGANDAQRGKPADVEQFFCLPNSAFATWYLEGYNEAKKQIEEGKKTLPDRE